MAYDSAFGYDPGATARSILSQGSQGGSPSFGAPQTGTPGLPPASAPAGAPPPGGVAKSAPNPLGWLQGVLPSEGPPPAGSTDPAYLAYQRSLEYQRSVASQAAQRQIANLQGQQLLGPEQLASQGVIARRGISGDAESRGVFRSGERLQSLGDERTQEAQRLAALRLAGAGQFGDIISNLQTNLAGYANQGAEAALASQARTA